MEAYINGYSAISPQNSFTEEMFLQEPREYNGVRFLKCVEPQYTGLLDPMAARRMSRIIKMGVTAAMRCLKNAGLEKPGAIITGTGMGCVEDTGRFLSSIYENEEKLLNPTPFIQSTHNTVAATIALMLKCNGYNSTYGHRGFSFETALLDALMLLAEGEADEILAGALDELTPDLFTITDRLGFWKKEPVNNLRLGEYKTHGTIAGEGVAFLALSRNKTEKSVAAITSVRTLFNPEGFDEVEELLKNQAKPNLVILGINGDNEGDRLYQKLRSGIFSNIPALYYKHLCGEYDTSTAFATTLAARIIKDQHVPEIMKTDDHHYGTINNILIYNHLRNRDHSSIVVSSC